MHLRFLILFCVYITDILLVLEPNRCFTFKINADVCGGSVNHERQDSIVLLSSCSRQEVDGTYILELHKDEKKGEAKATIVMDFCTEVVRVSSQLWFYSTVHIG
jgi:hypothetical protein